jgi:hypothetical protein
VLCPDAAFIVAEDHVHDPVEAILDRPMAPHDRPRRVGSQRKRGDLEAGLTLDLACGFAGALNDDDGLQTRPFVPFLKPVNIVDDSIGSGLDTTMIAVNASVLADFAVVKAARILLGHEERNIAVKRTLV